MPTTDQPDKIIVERGVKVPTRDGVLLLPVLSAAAVEAALIPPPG